MELHSPPSTVKKIAVVAMVLLIFAALFSYLHWASRIAQQTVLMPWIPELATYIAVSVLMGLLFAGTTFYRRPLERSLKRAARSFSSGACVGFVCALNSCSVGTYLLPGDIVQYESDYEIHVPGPSLGRTSRCEAGLWINDLKTDRHFKLCTNNSDLHNQMAPGMNAVWVTAHSNKIGSYLDTYTFIYKQPVSQPGL